MKIGFFAISFIVIILISGLVYFNIQINKAPKVSQNPNAMRFVAVGDSYTIGFDVYENESWPYVLATHLQSEGIGIELAANLAVTGYTAEDVINHELPDYEKLNPQFSTLLIGANDSSLGISVDEFRSDFIQILDRMLTKLSNKSNLVVLTIPDYTKTPRGRMDFADEGYSRAISGFNTVIKEEAKKRSLKIVDLENINEGINSDNSYYTADGLHPSAKQYKLWEERIYPVVKSVIEK